MQALIIIASLVGFIALTVGTALFVSAEFSLTALERSAVDAEVRERGDRRSHQVQNAHRTLSFQLSGAQLGITITTLITGYLAEPVIAQLTKPAFDAMGLSAGVSSALSLILALVIATSLSMVLGELVPKNLAITHPMKTARSTAGLMTVFSALFRWAINGLNGSANWLVRRLGIEPAEELRSARSPQELGALVRTSYEHGSLDAETATLVGRSLRFSERSAEDLMTPRVTVESLDDDATVRDLIVLASRTGMSRFPVVVDGDLDNIVGFVHIKQAFTVPVADRELVRVVDISRPVPVVPASLDGDSLMERIRGDGFQVAVVVDEYGGTAGIVTTEDLIEEIVGNVTDEHDREVDDVRRSGTGYVCSGLLRIDELAEATEYRAPDGPYDTLGGLIMFALGRIPAEGDVVEIPERAHLSDDDDEEVSTRMWRARVVKMDGKRVDLVSLAPADPGTASASTPAESVNPREVAADSVAAGTGSRR